MYVYPLDLVLVGERMVRRAGDHFGCLLPLDLLLLVVVGDLPLVNVVDLLPFDFLDDEFCLVDL